MRRPSMRRPSLQRRRHCRPSSRHYSSCRHLAPSTDALPRCSNRLASAPARHHARNDESDARSRRSTQRDFPRMLASVTCAQTTWEACRVAPPDRLARSVPIWVKNTLKYTSVRIPRGAMLDRVRGEVLRFCFFGDGRRSPADRVAALCVWCLTLAVLFFNAFFGLLFEDGNLLIRGVCTLGPVRAPAVALRPWEALGACPES